MAAKRQIVASDVLPMAEYAKNRARIRQEIVARKRNRRMEVGPYVTFYFECYDTMWFQVQEMVYIEKDLVQDNPPDYVWYYCRSQQTYYPYIIECPEAWEEVHPSANLDTGTSSTNAQ